MEEELLTNGDCFELLFYRYLCARSFVNLLISYRLHSPMPCVFFFRALIRCGLILSEK